ncbi:MULTISPECIES: methionine ABC transporter ATP-binding protein [unclassified Butyrivibrio]|uniref:methionine ABC transporter ATP-binding protein n=1 Tax=unclassified Butyrivibrio TaxID=2639466 RepID=UPI0003B52B2D|nr:MULTISPECIES: ATP-binding cassette domain-containing protein [unclassified Butyrivibrio]SEL04557.1 D-methionine transport system ATP-binding protein [Butyrivibrio sp. ob235]
MIKFENVGKVFTQKKNKVNALQDINLEIETGDIFGLIGFSGAGKSTLLRTINALEKPTSGKITVDGDDIYSLSPKELRAKRKTIGMIFQQFNILETKTVWENIALPLKLNHTPKKEIEERVDQMLKFVELEDKRDEYPGKLSGGQKQRIGIARALATRPSILLSDEATSALDPKTTDSILALLKKINRELGVTIVIVTHEMNVISSICNHVAVMEAGRIVEQGNVIDIFSEPKADITKNFVKTVIQDEVPEKLLQSIYEDTRNYKLLRLKFQSSDSTESVLAQVNKKFDIETNILFANISEIQEQILGIHIVQIIGSDIEIKKAEQYFTLHGVGYKELEEYKEELKEVV